MNDLNQKKEERLQERRGIGAIGVKKRAGVSASAEAREKRAERKDPGRPRTSPKTN